MSKSVFYLTRQASRTLRELHAHSVKQWGKTTADHYMADLYAVMNKVAAEPHLGNLRKHRSLPFLMVPAGKHFIVYDRIKTGIVIVTLLHQQRDIEHIIADMEPKFLTEIEAIKKSLKT